MNKDKANILADKAGDINTQLSRTNKVLLNIVMALFHKSFLKNKDYSFEDVLIDTIDDYVPNLLTTEGNVALVNRTFVDVIKLLLHNRTGEPVSLIWCDIQLTPIKVHHPEVIKHITTQLGSLSDLSEVDIMARYRVYVKLIQEYQLGFMLKQKAKELFASALNASEENIEDVLKRAYESLTPMFVMSDDNPIVSITGVEDMVVSDDEDAIRDKLIEAAEVINPLAVMKTGIQGWDKAFSDHGGILRGSFGEIQALSGHGKSDTARAVIAGVARHTIPFMHDDKLTPAIVLISLEDPSSRSISKIVNQLRREEGDCYDLEPWTREQESAYFNKETGRNGYRVILIKARQKELTANGVIEILQHVMTMGYEIHLAAVDYMGCLDVSNIQEANNSEMVKTAHARVMGFTQPNDIAFIALNQVAGAKYEKVIGTDQANQVKDGIKFAVHQNLSSQSNNIINVLDYRIIVNIVKGDTAAYHQFAMGKNRHGTSIHSKDLYSVYALHRAVGEDGVSRPAGFIRSDSNGPSMSLKSTPDLNPDCYGAPTDEFADDVF